MVRQYAYVFGAVCPFDGQHDSLILRNLTADWKRPSPGWKEAMNPFAILYAERFTGRRG
jgi:hypothetical protein